MIEKRRTGGDSERAFELYRAISDIDERFIDEALDDSLAERLKKRRRHSYAAVRTSAAAAAAVIVVAVGLGSLNASDKLSRSKSDNYADTAQETAFDTDRKFAAETDAAEIAEDPYGSDQITEDIQQTEAEEDGIHVPESGDVSHAPKGNSAPSAKNDETDTIVQDNGDITAADNDPSLHEELTAWQGAVSFEIAGGETAGSFALSGHMYTVYSADVDEAKLGGALTAPETAEYGLLAITGVSPEFAAAAVLPDGSYALALSERVSSELPDTAQTFSIIIYENGAMFCRFQTE